MFGEFAPIYESAGRLGFAPQAVDEMEVWQLASVLGMARPSEEEEASEPPDPETWGTDTRAQEGMRAMMEAMAAPGRR